MQQSDVFTGRYSDHNYLVMIVGCHIRSFLNSYFIGRELAMSDLKTEIIEKNRKFLCPETIRNL